MEALIKIAIFLILVVIGYFKGKKNEYEHLKQLREEEKSLRDILTFATRYPENTQQVLDPVLVSGNVVVSSDYFRYLLANLRKFFGGRYKAYEDLNERARRQAIVRMKQSAKNAGADKIFNVRIVTSRISHPREHGTPQVEVLAYGTAFVPARGSIEHSSAHISSTNDDVLEPFDLMKNTYTRKWLIWGLALVLLIFISSISNDQTSENWYYLPGAPWRIFFIISGIAAILLFLKARNFNVPLAEKSVLSLLSIPVLAATIYFASLFLNVFAFSQPAQVIYEYQKDRILHPITDTTLPTINVYEEVPEFWISQPVDKRITLTIRKGVFGMIFLDHSTLRDMYHEYFNKPQKPTK